MANMLLVQLEERKKDNITNYFEFITRTLLITLNVLF